jgi:methanogenic corrinoid protein MtbC1
MSPVPAPRGQRSMPADSDRDAVEAYLQQAVHGDGRVGVRLALDLIDNGVPSSDVIVNLLAAAQREVGERWLANRWNVAEEHLASGVSQKALDAVAHTIVPPASTGLIVVACAEGDWHSLPAQMFAELLRVEGFAVAFLGASTPADQVAAFLSRQRPDALAVSCNLPLFFGGLTRLVDAAHRHAIPVLAGGQALGRAPRRAACLGADAWAPGIDGAVAVLRGWLNEPPRVCAEATSFETAAVQLDFSAAEIAAEALRSLSAGYPPIASLNEGQLTRTRGDLAYITRFAAAARLVGDRTVLTEMLEWLRVFHANRGEDATAVNAGLGALAPVIRRTDPEAARLILDAVQDGPALCRQASPADAQGAGAQAKEVEGGAGHPHEEAQRPVRPVGQGNRDPDGGERDRDRQRERDSWPGGD